MIEKVGRNDPCPCGSGKKYKNCCLQSQQPVGVSSLGKRKITAKVLSGGGVDKAQQAQEAERGRQMKAAVDYNMLMERSFGEALHAQEEGPPIPSDPFQYLVEREKLGDASQG